MLFREGEDGSEFSELMIPLPWPGFGKEWRIYTDQEKWSITIIAIAEFSPLVTFRRFLTILWKDCKNWVRIQNNRRKHANEILNEKGPLP